MAHALLIDDDRAILGQLQRFVESHGYTTSTAESLYAGRERLLDELPDITLVDLMLPDGRGTRLLEDLDLPYPLRTVLVTGRSTVKGAVEALRNGFSDYLTKPVDTDRLTALLERVSACSEDASTSEGSRMLGESKSIAKVRKLIAGVAPTDISVLIEGETGTGKELVAREIHGRSKRREGPFVAINCAAITPSLAETELFGHERGSFTGAHRRHVGVFEHASGGTLFLDEINSMPIELQAKLLRVLDSGTFRRVGGSTDITVDTRILAACNEDLASRVEAGTFRGDLLFRLSAFLITLPPLREREDDSLLLADYFLRELSDRYGDSKMFSPEAIEAIQAATWPGNVRQLENAVRQSYLMADQVISPGRLYNMSGLAPARRTGLDVQVGMTIKEAEKELIKATLAREMGHKGRTAEALGISLKTLYNRLCLYKAEDGKDE